jgi:hypothetical protein
MRDWLAEDHLVYRRLDVVGALDMRSISHSIHAKDARGVRPYNPRIQGVNRYEEVTSTSAHG